MNDNFNKNTVCIAFGIVFAVLSGAVRAGDVRHAYTKSADETRLAFVDEIKFVKPVHIDLAPTNAPVAGGVYALRCQVVYEDHADLEAQTDAERAKGIARVKLTNTYLNSLLRKYFDDHVIGRDYAEIKKWHDERITDGALKLNDWFQEQNASEEVLGEIKIVTVQVEPEGNLRKDLEETAESDTRR